jgi:hypothetical protein
MFVLLKTNELHCTSRPAQTTTNEDGMVIEAEWRLFEVEHCFSRTVRRLVVFGCRLSQTRYYSVLNMLDRWSLPAHPDDITPEAHYLRTFWKLKTMWNRMKMRKLLRSSTARQIIAMEWHPEGRKAKRFKAELEGEISTRDSLSLSEP